MRADKAYASRWNRACLRRTRDPLHHPDKAEHVRNRKRLGSRGGRPPKFDEIDYRERHAVGPSARRNSLRDEATVLIATINEWL